MQPTETDLYEQLALYMNVRYPKIIYHFDLSGLWTPSRKLRNLYGRLNKRAYPDLFIAHVSHTGSTIKYGLFLELKKDSTVLFKKDGTLRPNPHHQEQAEVLARLREAGYEAQFAVGFEN